MAVLVVGLPTAVALPPRPPAAPVAVTVLLVGSSLPVAVAA
jgi:hypothetical protein